MCGEAPRWYDTEVWILWRKSALLDRACDAKVPSLRIRRIARYSSIEVESLLPRNWNNGNEFPLGASPGFWPVEAPRYVHVVPGRDSQRKPSTINTMYIMAIVPNREVAGLRGGRDCYVLIDFRMIAVECSHHLSSLLCGPVHRAIFWLTSRVARAILVVGQRRRLSEVRGQGRQGAVGGT